MKIAAIVLSAGASSRMGQPKQLLMLHQKSILQHVFDAVLAADFHKVYCVVGAHKDLIIAEVPSQVDILYNENWGLGLGSSICCGMHALINEGSFDAVFFFLADQPFVQLAAIQDMLALYKACQTKCVASQYNSGPGVPAIFPINYFDALQQLEGDRGAKKLLLSLGEEVINYDHKGTLVDVDTPDDYKQLQ